VAARVLSQIRVTQGEEMPLSRMPMSSRMKPGALSRPCLMRGAHSRAALRPGEDLLGLPSIQRGRSAHW
jgi:hypothetical protein